MVPWHDLSTIKIYVFGSMNISVVIFDEVKNAYVSQGLICIDMRQPSAAVIGILFRLIEPT